MSASKRKLTPPSRQLSSSDYPSIEIPAKAIKQESPFSTQPASTPTPLEELADLVEAITDEDIQAIYSNITSNIPKHNIPTNTRTNSTNITSHTNDTNPTDNINDPSTISNTAPTLPAVSPLLDQAQNAQPTLPGYAQYVPPFPFFLPNPGNLFPFNLDPALQTLQVPTLGQAEATGGQPINLSFRSAAGHPIQPSAGQEKKRRHRRTNLGPVARSDGSSDCMRLLTQQYLMNGSAAESLRENIDQYAGKDAHGHLRKTDLTACILLHTLKQVDEARAELRRLTGLVARIAPEANQGQE